MARPGTFTAAFVATVAVIVPAAWHGLDATVEKDGKRVRPLQRTIELDGTRITLDVDHNLVTTGDSVVAKLQAFSDTPKRITVDITVMRSDDSFGSRVAAPPVAIDKEHITLDATPDGGKVAETKLTMVPTGHDNKVDWFRIIVSKHGAKLDGDEGTNEDAVGEVAAVGVLGWTHNDFAISIKPKGKITNGAPFDVSVRIKNTSGHAFKHTPYIHLGTSVGLYGLENREAEFTVEEAETDDGASGDDGNESERAFKAGAVQVQTYTVTPQHTDLENVTLVASAFIWDGEGPDSATAGAFDAKTFRVEPAPAPEHVPAVAKQ
jgi:hypothetical protein